MMIFKGGSVLSLTPSVSLQFVGRSIKQDGTVTKNAKWMEGRLGKPDQR